MPKSRFNKRSHARAARHNPLGRPAAEAGAGAASTSNTTATPTTTTTTTSAAEAIIPLLAKLPDPNSSSPPAGVSASDRAWALASVASLLTDKSARKLLLGQQLVTRLVRALADPELSVRREAAGAIRNLCVEGGYEVRGELVNKGIMTPLVTQCEFILAQFSHTVNSAPANSTNGAAAPNGSSADAAMEKPFEQMNRKERRHASRASTTANGISTTSSSSLPQSNGAESGAQIASSAPAALAALDEDPRRELIELADNLVTVVWCIGETSAKLLSHLNAHAPLLSRVLAGCISLAAFSSTTSSSSPFPWSALQKERSALLDLGVQAANAACALADDNAAFAAALAGRPAPTLPSARGKKGKAHREEEVVDDEARDGAGLEALHEALSALKAIREAGQAQSSVQGQVAMLGVLACGTLRNILASLSASGLNGVHMLKDSSDPSGALTLEAYEHAHVVPELLALLDGVDLASLTARVQTVSNNEAANKSNTEAAEKSNESRRAEEALQTVQLALEVLAEIAGAQRAPGAEGEDEWLEAEDAIEGEAVKVADESGDDAMDAVMESAQKPAGVESEAMEEDAIPKEENGDADMATRKGFAQSPVAQLVTVHRLPERLLRLARPSSLESIFASAGASTGTTSSKSTGPGMLRTVHLRALAALNNLLLSLAAHAPPPPSNPPSTPQAQARVAAFHAWARPGPENIAHAQLTGTWTQTFDLAASIASVRSVAAGGLPSIAPGSSHAATSSSASTNAKLRAPEEGTDEGADGRAIVDAAVGCMWCIARALEGVVPVSKAQIEALQSAYHSAGHDGMRAKCIGALACVARRKDGDIEENRTIGHFLLSILRSLPFSSSGGASATSSSAESMLAALNGIFDIYADEEAPYDAPVFRKDAFLDTLQSAVAPVRNVTRRIDKRTQPSLRFAADEALENLVAFVKYRETLGF